MPKLPFKKAVINTVANALSARKQLKARRVIKRSGQDADILRTHNRSKGAPISQMSSSNPIKQSHLLAPDVKKRVKKYANKRF